MKSSKLLMVSASVLLYLTFAVGLTFANDNADKDLIAEKFNAFELKCSNDYNETLAYKKCINDGWESLILDLFGVNKPIPKDVEEFLVQAFKESRNSCLREQNYSTCMAGKIIGIIDELSKMDTRMTYRKLFKQNENLVGETSSANRRSKSFKSGDFDLTDSTTSLHVGVVLKRIPLIKVFVIGTDECDLRGIYANLDDDFLDSPVVPEKTLKFNIKKDDQNAGSGVLKLTFKIDERTDSLLISGDIRDYKLSNKLGGGNVGVSQVGWDQIESYSFTVNPVDIDDKETEDSESNQHNSKNVLHSLKPKIPIL